MDLRRLRAQEWLAGVCGGVLLVVTFLDWYDGRSAWQAFGVLDVALALTALSAIGLAAVTAAHRTQAVATAVASLLAIAAIVVAAIVVYRVVSPPGDADREFGAWIGLVAYLGLTAATLRSVRDDRFPTAVRDASRVEIPPLPAPPREGAGEASSS